MAPTRGVESDSGRCFSAEPVVVLLVEYYLWSEVDSFAMTRADLDGLPFNVGTRTPPFVKDTFLAAPQSAIPPHPLPTFPRTCKARYLLPWIEVSKSQVEVKGDQTAGFMIMVFEVQRSQHGRTTMPTKRPSRVYPPFDERIGT